MPSVRPTSTTTRAAFNPWKKLAKPSCVVRNCPSASVSPSSPNMQMAPLAAQIYAHRQTVEIGAKLTARMLFSGAPCCHLFQIQLFLQLSHQFCQHFLRIPLHRATRLRTLRRPFTILSKVVMLLPRNSSFLSRWNSDELVSQGGGFPLELLDL